MKLRTDIFMGHWSADLSGNYANLAMDEDAAPVDGTPPAGWTVMAGSDPAAGHIDWMYGAGYPPTLLSAGLERTLTGLPAGEWMTLAVTASFDSGWFAWPPWRLPYVELVAGSETQHVDVSTAWIFGADDPANEIYLRFQVPASGQVTIRLVGDQLGLPGVRMGTTTFWGCRLLQGDVWHLVADGRYPDPDPTAGQWVLDGYRQSWDVGDTWPAQPPPQTGGLQLLAVQPELLPPIEIGTRVTVQTRALFPNQNGNDGELGLVELAEFHARISDAGASPTTVAVEADGQLQEVAAIQVALTLVDLVADLGGIFIGAQPWPEEYGTDRIDRIFAAAGLTTTAPGLQPNTLDVFLALDVDHRSIADVAEEHLSQLARYGNLATLDVAGKWERGYMGTQVAGAGGFLGEVAPDITLQGGHRWAIYGMAERMTMGGGPLQLQRVGDEIQAVIEPSTDISPGHMLVPSSMVDLAVDWRRDKGRATNRATVGGVFSALYGELEAGTTATQVVAEWADQVKARGPVTVAKDATLKYWHSAVRLAGMLLGGDRAEVKGHWAVEAATIYLNELPNQAEASRVLYPGLFPSYYAPDLYTDKLWGQPYGRAFVISELQPAHQLEGTDWSAGQLVGASLNVARGQAAVTVQLRPTVSRQRYSRPYDPETEVPGDSAPASPKGLGLKHPGTTYKDKGDGTPYIDPSLTYYQLRLARNE